MIVNISNRQVLTLLQILIKLDRSDPKESVKNRFSAKVIYALAKNCRQLRSHAEDLEKTRVATFKKYQQQGEETLTGEAAKKFQAEFGQLLDEKIPITFYTVSIDDLDLNTNQIPIDVLTELLGTIVED